MASTSSEGSQHGPHSTVEEREKRHDSPTMPSSAATGTAQSSTKEDAKGKKGGFKLPEWVTMNLKNPRSLKNWFRCWVVSWVCMLLLLPDKTLQTLGQAAFFVAMVTIFIPSNLPVFLWLFANATLVIGALLGWAWGCAGMAASLQARDSTLLASQLENVQSTSESGATNPEAQYQQAIFQAQFLDPRSSAVYGVFLAIGTYCSALLFTSAPKLRFTSIFMTIVLDVMCTYGPLFPITYYDLGSLFMVPIGISLAISSVCMILIFPETLSHVWQGNLIKLLQAHKGFLATHEAFLKKIGATSSTSFAQALAEYDGKLREQRSKQIQLMELIAGQKGFLHMEITYSALSATDLIRLATLDRNVALRLFGLLGFNDALETSEVVEEGTDENSHPAPEEDMQDLKKPVHVHDTPALLRIHRRMHAAEKEHHVTLQGDLLPIMIEGSHNLLQKGFAALDEIIAWLEYTNTHRWLKQQTAQQHAETLDRLKTAADDLEEALHLFNTDERLKLLAPYEKHFTESRSTGSMVLDPEGAKSFRLGARSLYMCLSWCANALGAGKALLSLTRAAHDIAASRPRSRIRLPTGLSKLGRLMMSSKGGDAVHALPADDLRADDADPSPTPTEPEEDVFDVNEDRHSTNAKGSRRSAVEEAKTAKRKEKQRRRRLARINPDALPPEGLYHHFGRALASWYRFFWSPRGVFALRYAIAGIAVWIPSVATQRSAAFSYEHRGLWAIIMAQFSVTLTHGEQVFSMASRIIGTVLGAMLGAALWYISCGNSPHGNAYGFGAVTAVAFVPFVFLRLYAPMQLFVLVLMTFVTLVMVIGFSWIDAGHLTITVSSGVGIGVAWRRMLLVLIGIAAGSIVMLFPRPPSTREAVRHGFAKLTSKRILRLYTSIVESWASQTLNFRSGEAKPGDGQGEGAYAANAAAEPASLASFRSNLVAAYAQHQDIAGKVGLANLDLQVQGRWPGPRYSQMLKTHGRMLGALGQLYMVLKEPEYDVIWRRRFAHMTAILDPATISDICLTLSLLGQALLTGSRLPHATALIRERAVKNQGLTIHVEDRLRSLGSSEATEPLSLEILRSPQMMQHVQASMALMVFIVNLDEAMAICRALVGEVPLPGFEELRDRWDERAMLLRA